MKRTILTLLTLLSAVLATQAQDSLFVLKSGKVVANYEIEEGDYITFHRPEESPAAFKLIVSDLSYRGATFTAIPTDNEMKYQVAQTDLSKYTAYDSDMAFIEGYDFAYYKTLKANMPWIPAQWYNIMETEGYYQQGEYSWKTRILTPEQDYIMYAYGFEVDDTDEENPVKVLTPLVKQTFHTPSWQKTSNTTFDVTCVSQTVTSGKVVSTAIITPSDENEKYFVAFIDEDNLKANYANSEFTFMMGRMGDCEILGYVKNYDWGTSSLLHKGEITISNTETGLSTDQNLTAGKSYSVIVCGISDDGLVTTDIQRTVITAPTE